MKKHNTFREFSRVLGSLGGIAGLGISVISPLIICILVTVMLCGKYGIGEWLILVGIAVGLISSCCGVYRSVKRYIEIENKADNQNDRDNQNNKDKDVKNGKTDRNEV